MREVFRKNFVSLLQVQITLATTVKAVKILKRNGRNLDELKKTANSKAKGISQITEEHYPIIRTQKRRRIIEILE